MALHIDPAARAAFAPFYDFALAQTPPDALCPLVLESMDDAALAARVSALDETQREAITCVIVKNCLALQSLAPLDALQKITCVGVWNCPKLRGLWRVEGQPLWGVAFADCKSLQDLAPLAACADTLCHFFLQGRAWNLPRIQTLDPLPNLHALVTCDIAVRKASHSGTIYFETCFPKLEALTVTPNLAKYFKRVKH